MSRRHPKRKMSGGRFVRLPHDLLQHPAVTTLSHAAFRVLVLLSMQFNGRNNGAVGITAKQAAEAGIGSDKTLYRALRELEQRGLIQATYPASRVPPRPTMYVLSWLPEDDTEYSHTKRSPTHAYRDWRQEATA